MRHRSRAPFENPVVASTMLRLSESERDFLRGRSVAFALTLDEGTGQQLGSAVEGEHGRSIVSRCSAFALLGPNPGRFGGCVSDAHPKFKVAADFVLEHLLGWWNDCGYPYTGVVPAASSGSGSITSRSSNPSPERMMQAPSFWLSASDRQFLEGRAVAFALTLDEGTGQALGSSVEDPHGVDIIARCAAFALFGPNPAGFGRCVSDSLPGFEVARSYVAAHVKKAMFSCYPELGLWVPPHAPQAEASGRSPSSTPPGGRRRGRASVVREPWYKRLLRPWS